MSRLTRDWPDETSYFHFACKSCAAQFLGPKHARQCWPCEEEARKEHEWQTVKKQAEMEAEYGPRTATAGEKFRTALQSLKEQA